MTLDEPSVGKVVTGQRGDMREDKPGKPDDMHTCIRGRGLFGKWHSVNYRDPEIYVKSATEPIIQLRCGGE